jgi:hypothetical protein
MRILPSSTLRKCFCWLLLAFAACLHAQDADDTGQRKGISDFVSSVAHTVYNLAWPTATYRDFRLDSIAPVDGGFDVLVTLDGLSGIDQSDLWVQLVFLIRNGGLQDVRVKNDNHVLVPPFATSAALAGAAADLAKQYAQRQANGAPAPDAPSEQLPDPYPTPHFAPQTVAPQQAPAPTQPTPQPAPRSVPPPPVTRHAPPISGTIEAEGTCLINSTGHTLTFDYRWGALKWIKYQLAPDQEVKIWWPYRDAASQTPPLAIRYDDDFAAGYTERDYNLLRTPTALPVSCDRVQNYRFIMEGSKIAIYTVGQ